jgi:hypothetical protein
VSIQFKPQGTGVTGGKLDCPPRAKLLLFIPGNTAIEYLLTVRNDTQIGVTGGSNQKVQRI